MQNVMSWCSLVETDYENKDVVQTVYLSMFDFLWFEIMFSIKVLEF